MGEPLPLTPPGSNGDGGDLAIQEMVWRAWNIMASPHQFLACIRLPVNATRREKLRSRLKHHRPSEIIEAINRIPRSKSLMGERPGRFYGKGLTITSLLRPTTNMIQRILEGEFDDGPEPPRRPSYDDIR